MNPRLPYAAKTLADEITAIDEDATIEAGDLDGLNIYRSLTIHSPHLTRLEEALVQVSKYDRRVHRIDDHDEYLTIHFPGDQIVWSRGAYNLGDMYKAIEKKPAKKAAKKATKKKAEPDPDS